MLLLHRLRGVENVVHERLVFVVDEDIRLVLTKNRRFE